MEGSVFFLCAWVGWIITTFFMNKKNKNRVKYTIYLLGSVIVLPLEWSWNEMTFSLLKLIVLWIAFAQLVHLGFKRYVYAIICSFIILLAYCTFQLMAIVDPVWVFIDSMWLLSITLIILTFVLQQDPLVQCLIVCIGSITGEFIFQWIVSSYHMASPMETMLFFDSLAICIATIVSISYIKTLMTKLEQYVYLLEKERGKQL